MALLCASARSLGKGLKEYFFPESALTTQNKFFRGAFRR
jgi:hypothetical protein